MMKKSIDCSNFLSQLACQQTNPPKWRIKHDKSIFTSVISSERTDKSSVTLLEIETFGDNTISEGIQCYIGETYVGTCESGL